MLRISYRDTDRRAILSWDAIDSDAAWLGVITRLVFDNCDDVAQEGPAHLTLPWWSFSAIRPRLLEVFQGFHLKLGSEVDVTPAAGDLLRRATLNAARYQAATHTVALESAELLTRLEQQRLYPSSYRAPDAQRLPLGSLAGRRDIFRSGRRQDDRGPRCFLLQCGTLRPASDHRS